MQQDGVIIHMLKLKMTTQIIGTIQLERLIKKIYSVKAISIPELIKKFEWKEIDLLKMDIEGSEIEVLNESIDQINSVKMIIMELHDRFRPGCETALFNAIKKFSFVYETAGEKQLLRNTMSVPFA